MALVQMISQEKLKEEEVADVFVLDTPPEVEEIESGAAATEEEEDEPVLEEEAPQISLDQLEVALNPGVGGSLVGDFVMPTVRPPLPISMVSADFAHSSDLDQTPRSSSSCSPISAPAEAEGRERPGRPADQARRRGPVVEAVVESSNLPEHDPCPQRLPEPEMPTAPTKLTASAPRHRLPFRSGSSVSRERPARYSSMTRMKSGSPVAVRHSSILTPSPRDRVRW
ncbi:MAG: hypothetical protein R3F21_09035 [Myxococcota bacterium]